MPKLNQRETKTIKLKTVEGAEVVCYSSFTAGDVEKLADGKLGSIILPLSLVIKSWNLVGDDDQPLPVTEDNIRLLDARDIKVINDEIQVSLTDFLGKA